MNNYFQIENPAEEKGSCFIIAEAGVNHNGSIDLARQLIDAAAEANADAVKFQSFITEEIVSINAPKAKYQTQTTDSHESQFEMIKKLELSKDAHRQLMDYAEKKGIIFLSTPFDEKSLDQLVELGVSLIKVGSGEITNHPFLEKIGQKGLPTVLSTGMSTLQEVAEAVSILRNSGCKYLILLHCTSNYPARVEDTNLLAMKTMSDTFNLPVGYSDHTPGIYIPIAAVAMGSCVIEKHFTLDKNLPGPDHRASLEPNELKEMIKGIRITEKALGSPEKLPVESELEVRDVARKSIVAKADIHSGIMVTKEMLAFKRPGTGISPRDLDKVVGKVSSVFIEKDTVVSFDMLEESK